MSRDAVCFYLDKHLDTGCLGFYYDFDHWSGTHVLNAGSAAYPAYTRYSGSVVGDFNNFTGHASGRGSFSNYFAFRHNCTVGGNHGKFPRFGEFVCLFSNATVIGNTNIGNNVFISSNTLVKDVNISDNSIVFGQSPNLIIKRKPKEYFYENSPFKHHQQLLE